MLASETGVLDIRRRERAAQGPPAAGQDLPRRPRAAAASSRTTRSSARSRRSSRTASGSSRASSTSHDLPARPPRVPRVEPLRSRQLAFGYTQEDLRVILAPLARERRGADRLDGQRPRARRALRPAAAALRVLQAALRAGHEPADRLDARVRRDERRHERRLRAQPARRDARARPPARDRRSRSCATPSSRACARSTPTVFKAHTLDITWPVAEGADGLDAGARAHLRARPTRRSPTASTSSSSPTATSARTASPIPALLAVVDRAPPPRARGHAARRPASWSSRASRARCTTSRR